MVAALALMDVSENCLALLWLDAALVDTSDAAPDQLFVDYGVGGRSALYLPSLGLISRQLFAHQVFEDGLGPWGCCYFFDCQNYDLDEGGWAGRRQAGVNNLLLD